MRTFTILAIGVLFSVTAFAQTELVVAPGLGTLNQAVEANKGNVIYKLQAGGWYGVTAVIENTDFTLTIIGEIPANPSTMPAMIQIGSDALGVPFSKMFNVFRDFTLKNVFIVDANENHVQASTNLITMQKDSTRLVIDNVVFDPLNTNGNVANFIGVNCKLFFTNCLVVRAGTLTHANDGGNGNTFLIQGPITNGLDTMYVENNTFVSTGSRFCRNSNAANGKDNFIWINHNTWIGHKSQFMVQYYMKDYFVTNNLFFDFNTQPWNQTWNSFSPDGNINVGGRHSRFALVNVDTIKGETLPSARKCLVQYNLWYLNPKTAELAISWEKTHTFNNDGVTPIPPAYWMGLFYPPDSAHVNREAGMFGSAAFPNFKAGNLLKIDPQFADPKIYALSDSLYEWTIPAMMTTAYKFDPAKIPPITSWANFWWNADQDGLGNPTAWPRFNSGVYTNQAALTGSIEGLPLGDLNHYPQAKAIWAANKAAIQAHIVAGNTNKILMTGVESLGSEMPNEYSLSQNYPNPFNPSSIIRFGIPKNGFISLRVYNLVGQEVATLVNGEIAAGYHEVQFQGSNLSSGVYLYRLNANGVTVTKKMVLMK